MKYAYFALNKDKNHWITCVMHTRKKEFQILDSLRGEENISEAIRKFVENFVSFVFMCVQLTI